MADDAHQSNYEGGGIFGSSPFTGEDESYEGGSVLGMWRVPNGGMSALLEGVFIFLLLITIAYLTLGSNGVPGWLVTTDIIVGLLYLANETVQWYSGKDLRYMITSSVSANPVVPIMSTA